MKQTPHKELLSCIDLGIIFNAIVIIVTEASSPNVSLYSKTAIQTTWRSLCAMLESRPTTSCRMDASPHSGLGF